MTDFLKRVSQTALGLAPVAQPLVASRYAQSAHQPAPEPLPPQEHPPESFMNHAPEFDAEVPSPSPPSSPPTAIAETSIGQQESAGLLSQEIVSTKATSAALPQPDGVGERAAMPFDVPASPSREPLNAQDQIAPTPQTHTQAIPSGTELEQSPSRTTDEESYAPQHAERRAVEIVKAQHAPHRRRDAESARASTTREVATFVAGETAPLAHGNAERSSEVSPVLNVETTTRRDSPAESFKQSSGAEHEIEADETRAASMARRNESNPPDQATARRAASPLHSSKEDKAANASTGHVVHVTIGRIDVRAVMPPPLPVESSAPPAPQLSLDEYLRQHNGRTR